MCDTLQFRDLVSFSKHVETGFRWSLVSETPFAVLNSSWGPESRSQRFRARIESRILMRSIVILLINCEPHFVAAFIL
jgi:hypothetical protein